MTDPACLSCHSTPLPLVPMLRMPCLRCVASSLAQASSRKIETFTPTGCVGCLHQAACVHGKPVEIALITSSVSITSWSCPWQERMLPCIAIHTGCCTAGHSLGGALATLAAYDLKNVADKANLDVHISCYTFGAPRVGNHSFAEDFDRVINDCFHVVNHQVLEASRKGLMAACHA